MNPLSRDPVMAGFMSVFNPEVIEGIFYFFYDLTSTRLNVGMTITAGDSWNKP
jgi:hypothetical protein